MPVTRRTAAASLVHNKNESVLARFAVGKLVYGKDGICQRQPSIAYFRNKDTVNVRKRDQRVLAAETDRMKYLGRNFGPRVVKTEPKYYVGVLDEKTGKMCVYDAKPFKLEPQFEGNTEEEKEGGADQDLSYLEKRDKLMSAFGSKKTVKLMEARHRHHVSDEVLNQSMGKAASEILATGSIKPVTATTPEENLLIPPWNKEAKTLKEIYNLDDVVLPDELEALQTRAKVFVDVTAAQLKEWSVNNSYGYYIINRLARLPLEEKYRLQKAKLLLYMHYLILLYTLRAQDLKKSGLPAEIPFTIGQRISDTYTVKGTTPDGKKEIRSVPSRLKDKLAVNILLLVLHIDEFSSCLTDIQKDLKIGVQKLSNTLKALGCIVSTKKADDGTKSMTAVLTLPPTFPKKKPSQQRRGR